MIHFTCGACGAKLKVKPELAGKTGTCPTCKEPTRVPQASPTIMVDEAPSSPQVRTPVAPSPRKRLNISPLWILLPVAIGGLVIFAQWQLTDSQLQGDQSAIKLEETLQRSAQESAILMKEAEEEHNDFMETTRKQTAILENPNVSSQDKDELVAELEKAYKERSAERKRKKEHRELIQAIKDKK